MEHEQSGSDVSQSVSSSFVPVAVPLRGAHPPLEPRLYRAGLNTIDDNEHATVPVGQPAHADARRLGTALSTATMLDRRRWSRTDFHFIYTTAHEKFEIMRMPTRCQNSHPQRTALFADLTILDNNTTFLPRT